MKMHKDTAYVRDYLWLPKTAVSNTQGLKAMLEFDASGTQVCAWDDTHPTHLRVPRAFMSDGDLDAAPFDVVYDFYDDYEVTHTTMRNSPKNEVQRDGIRGLLLGSSGIIHVACGVGKTYMAIAAAVALDTPFIVVVHTEDLGLQWKEEILFHTDMKPEDIGWVQAATDDWESKKCCIAMVQTLASRADSLTEEFRRRWGVAIFDEVHHLGAPYFNKAASLFGCIRWGLTATLDRGDGLENLYKWHLGPVHFEHLEQELPLEGMFVEWGYDPTDEDMRAVTAKDGQFHLGLFANWLAENESYIDKVSEYIEKTREHGYNCLIISQGLELLKKLHARTADSSLLIGEVKGQERREALKTGSAVFVQYELGKEALSRKDLDCVLVITPIAKKGALQQVAGRVQRALEGKERGMMIYFVHTSFGLPRGMAHAARRWFVESDYSFVWVDDE